VRIGLVPYVYILSNFNIRISGNKSRR